MTSYRLSDPISGYIVEIMAWSEHKLGPQHTTRYRRLLSDTMDDVAADLGRFGAARIARFKNVWEYELRHSKDRAPRHQRIRSPWHKITYRPLPDGTVEFWPS